METLGVWLRQTREARGETLREAEAATRIRLRFLETLEEGEFVALPGGPVQIRGFLRIYARHLDLPIDEVLARYAQETQSSEPTPVEAVVTPFPAPPAQPVDAPSPTPTPTPAPTPSPPRAWMSLETLIVLTILIVALVVIAIGVIYLLSQSGRAAVSDATTLAAVGGGETPQATAPVPDVEMATPLPATPIPTFPASPGGYVSLKLEATEHVWARVTVDGETAFEAVMAPGQIQNWSGREAVVVDTGNGAGLLLTVNGQLQGTVGERNQIARRAWGPEGELAAP